ncbi:MAG: hypothetical protein LDL26_04535 [Caenispirillum bisanense]|nr:hypothetical protein [Caenispirillum bisanense]MCA1972623.1 hypothetical protein [Caenispirillum sp.]
MAAIMRMPDVASRLLMLAVMVRSLPGRPQFEAFAAAALREVPGVAEARVHGQTVLERPALARGWTRYDLVSGCETFGFVDLRITDAGAFAPHSGDVQNVLNLLAHELERRATLACLEEAHEALARRHEDLERSIGDRDDAPPPMLRQSVR